MTTSGPPHTTTPLRVALALRWRIWRRRFVSPLEGVLLAIACGVAWLAGGALGARIDDDGALLRTGATLATVAIALAATVMGRQGLFRARELSLLLAHGLTPRDLVRVRAVELLALLAVAAAPATLLLGAALGPRASAPGLLVASVAALGLGLTGLALIAAWAWAALGARTARLVPVAGVALAALGVALVPRPLSLLAHPWTPGGALVAAAGGVWSVPLVLLAGAAGLLLVAGFLVPRGFAARLDHAASRPGRASPLLWKAANLPGLLLGGQARALLRRDLTLLLRGAFPRGLVILALLPLSLFILHAAPADPRISAWHLELIALLLTGVVSAGAGFLFGVDFPRARRARLVLERTQPLRGRPVLLSRWAPAVGYTSLFAAAAAVVVANAPRAPLTAAAGEVLLGSALMGLIVSHHAVTYGMRSETRLDPAEAAAYPLNGGVLVILFALGLLISPLAALAYPLIWFQFAADAVRRWETAEVELVHQAAA